MSNESATIVQRLWNYCHVLRDDGVSYGDYVEQESPLRYEHLQDFIACYHPENRFERRETEEFKAFGYDELIQRDKVSLDIFWLKDESLEDTANLPDPEVLARDIAENLEIALEQFSQIYENLEEGT